MDVVHGKLYYGLMLVWALILFTALGHIIYRKCTLESMRGWMLFTVFVPIVAAPLCFLIGVHKRESKNEKSFIILDEIPEYEPYRLSADDHALVSILKRNGIASATKGNVFTFISDPAEAYEAMTRETDAFRSEKRKLLRKLKRLEGAMIVVGDFNTWNKHRYEILFETMHGLRLSSLKVSQKVKRIFGYPIDFIFYRGLAPLRSDVWDDHRLSDHHPLYVYAEFEFET